MKTKITIYGKVQDVGLRVQIKAMADKFGVRGTVENLPDGSVVVTCKAEVAALANLLYELVFETKLANINQIKVEAGGPDNDWANFIIVPMNSIAKIESTLHTGTQTLFEVLDELKKIHHKQDQTNKTLATIVYAQDQTNKTLTRLVEGQDQTNKTLTRLVEGQDQTNKTLTRLVEGQDRILEGQDRILEGQDRIIDNQEQSNKTLTRLVEGQDRIVEGQDRIIDNQEQSNKTLTRLVEGQDHIMDGQDQMINLLKSIDGKLDVYPKKP